MNTFNKIAKDEREINDIRRFRFDKQALRGFVRDRLKPLNH